MTTALPRRSQPARRSVAHRSVAADRARRRARCVAFLRRPPGLGGSGVVVLEAAAGLGKTALLEYGGVAGGEAGCLVRRAAPGRWSATSPSASSGRCWRRRCARPRARARQLLDGAAAAAGELLLDGTAPRRRLDDADRAQHAVAVLGDRRAAPLALVVDDAQWADRASLEVLSYLARRVEDLPLLILMARAPTTPTRRRTS